VHFLVLPKAIQRFRCCDGISVQLLVLSLLCWALFVRVLLVLCRGWDESSGDALKCLNLVISNCHPYSIICSAISSFSHAKLSTDP
jgi:hypothetical protein